MMHAKISGFVLNVEAIVECNYRVRSSTPSCSLINMYPLMDVHCFLGIKSGRSDPKKIIFPGCQIDNSLKSKSIAIPKSIASVRIARPAQNPNLNLISTQKEILIISI